MNIGRRNVSDTCGGRDEGSLIRGYTRTMWVGEILAITGKALGTTAPGKRLADAVAAIVEPD